VKIVGTDMAKKISLYEVLSFSISPNLCQRFAMLNADVPNCYKAPSPSSIKIPGREHVFAPQSFSLSVLWYDLHSIRHLSCSDFSGLKFEVAPIFKFSGAPPPTPLGGVYSTPQTPELVGSGLTTPPLPPVWSVTHGSSIAV